MRENLTGWENEYVKYVQDVEDHVQPNGQHRRIAKFVCKHCGSEFVAKVVDVKSGNTTSCGCRRKQMSSERSREITRKKVFEHGKFGMLTPISFADDHIRPDGGHRPKILCKCDCGNETIVRAADLLNGHTTSCGCRMKQIVSKMRREITRKRVFERGKFGMLMPISLADDDVDPNGKHLSRILCKCDCGNETVVLATDLLSGHTTSCGCRKMSIAAERINDLLLNLHIPFVSELRLPGCFNPETGVLLPFDFAILDENKRVKTLIEYQGEQHYRDTGEFGRLQRSTTDKIKRDFCQTNNIPL